MSCAVCPWVEREPAARGRVFYRCRNPEGRLGADGSSTFGRVVDRPIGAGADPLKAGIKVPAWCPRRSGRIATAPGEGGLDSSVSLRSTAPPYEGEPPTSSGVCGATSPEGEAALLPLRGTSPEGEAK